MCVYAITEHKDEFSSIHTWWIRSSSNQACIVVFQSVVGEGVHKRVGSWHSKRLHQNNATEFCPIFEFLIGWMEDRFFNYDCLMLFFLPRSSFFEIHTYYMKMWNIKMLPEYVAFKFRKIFITQVLSMTSCISMEFLYWFLMGLYCNTIW